MRQRIGLAGIYADALYRMRPETDAGVSRPLSETCPFTLDELLAGHSEVAALIAKLGSSPTLHEGS
jgi:hypothetical protein